jgi:uncharacterized membrane protein required for colicin V production
MEFFIGMLIGGAIIWFTKGLIDKMLGIGFSLVNSLFGKE